jgi:hypothetical protein
MYGGRIAGESGDEHEIGLLMAGAEGEPAAVGPR